MDNSELRKFLHDVNNALNAAKIHAYLLRRVNGDVVDKETMDGLEKSIMDAERMVGTFQRRVHEEIAAQASEAPQDSA